MEHDDRPAVLDQTDTPAAAPTPAQAPPTANIVVLVPKVVGKSGRKRRNDQSALNGRDADRTKVDREAVRRDYETTRMTLREIGAKHGVPHNTVGRWGRMWRRSDFDDTVLDATVRMLAGGQITNDAEQKISTLSQSHRSTDRNKINSVLGRHAAVVVLKTAEINAKVIVAHRDDVRALRATAAEMAQELHSATMRQPELIAFFEKLLDIEGLDGPERQGLRSRFNEFLRVHNRIGSMQKLADTFLKLQSMDRKAHDLDKDTKPTAPEIPDTKTIKPEDALDSWKTFVQCA
jgi:hypothetical protein